MATIVNDTAVIVYVYTYNVNEINIVNGIETNYDYKIGVDLVAGLKREKERDVSHRVFKYYKATGEFPKDVTELDCYYLMAKFNYFIAADFDIKFLKQLRQLREIVEDKHIAITVGDFTLSQLDIMFRSMNVYKFKTIYIDCSISDISKTMQIATNMSGHFEHTIIYILDNIEFLRKDGIKYMLKIMRDIQNSNRYIVCSSLQYHKIKESIKMKLNVVRLGPELKAKDDIRRLVGVLYHESDRAKATDILTSSKIGEKYFFSLASYNLFNFYSKDMVSFDNNLRVLETAGGLLYKIDTKTLWKYVVYSFNTTDVKRAVAFPPRKDKDNKGIAYSPIPAKKTVKASKSSVKALTKSSKPKTNKSVFDYGK